MKLINTTSKTITIYTQEGLRTLTPQEPRLRAFAESVLVDVIDGVDVHDDVLHLLDDLPEPQEGVTYIVSGIVAAAVKVQGHCREDFLRPGTGAGDGAVRGPGGRMLGVTVLKKI